MTPELPPALRALLERPAHERRLGAFSLVEQLGRGGFAPVWLAREIYEGKELRTAAVKLFALAPPETGNPARDTDSAEQAAARHKGHVIDEARAICRVEHPNVVRFYSLLLDEERGVIGLAMEYVAGTPLDRRIRASRAGLSAREALDVGIAVASALAAVHAAGLVHRDVKPPNVVEKNGVYKLIDFGIAAAEEIGSPASRARTRRSSLPIPDLAPAMSGQRVSALSQSYTIRDDPSARADTVPVLLTGTIGYIDPVCLAQGAPATAASDLYGLGALLYECLTTRVPAQSADAPRLRGDVLSGIARAPSVAELAPEAPEPLARLIDALVSPERAERPESAARVAEELCAIRDGRAAAGPLSRSSARRAIVAATACIAIAGAAGVALVVRGRESRRAPVARAPAICSPADPSGCERACDEGGDADSCLALGLMYSAGTGVAKDAARAAALFRKACDRRSVAGCYSLAGALERGAGVPQDDGEALRLYAAACEAGNAQACSSVGRFEELGRATRQDPARALAHYHRACAGGYGIACSNEGLLYEAGLGVAEDTTKARELFERACAMNAAIGCGHLGRTYAQGIGVPRDDARAAPLLEIACNAGDGPSCTLAGRISRGDDARARAFYRKACDANDAAGCDALRALDALPGAPDASPRARPKAYDATRTKIDPNLLK